MLMWNYRQDCFLTNKNPGLFIDAVEDDCSLQEHQHTSECYKLPDRRSLRCRAMAHSHNPECYDGEGILVEDLSWKNAYRSAREQFPELSS